MKRLACLALLLVSCSNENGVSDLPPKPENGQQLVLPSITIEPGTDSMLCWYTTLPSDADVWVNKFEVFQGVGGHHIVGFTTDEQQPDGTITDCSSPASMAFLKPLLTGNDVHGFDLPDGYGVRIPAGSRMVFQTHYVNAGDVAVKVRDVVNLHYVDGTGITPVGSFANTTVDFSIPAGAQGHTVTYECPITQTMNVFLLFGHMHENGARMEISVGPAGSLSSIYSVDPWEPQFRDVSPKRVWDMASPLVLTTTDVIRVTCTWNNPGSTPLGFPNEMCASLLWVYPTMEPIVCSAAPL